MTLVRLGILAAILLGLAIAVVAQTPLLFEGAADTGVDRVRGYEVGTGADPSFALSGGDELVRLVTNALVPAELGGGDAPYALTLRIGRPGKPEETREIHLESHRTGPRTGTDDPCFDADRTPIADSRHVDIVLDPPAEPGTELHVSGLGPTPSILRAWTWRPREGEERARRYLALDADQRSRIGRPIGLLAWDHLVDAERERWTAGHFARLAADGQEGRDHRAHDFFVAAVQPDEGEEAGGLVRLQSPQTWLVQGPATVSLALAATAETTASHLELSRVAGEEAVVAAWDVTAGAAPANWTADLPAGLQTLVLRASAPTTVALAMVIPAAARVPPEEGAPAPAADANTVTLRTTPVVPGVEALFDARLPSDPAVRSVEVEVWGDAPTDPSLTLTTLAGGKTTVDTVRPVLPTNAYDVAVDRFGVERPLRGPARVKVLLPADATELGVTTDAAVLLRFRVPFHVDEADPGPPATTRTVGVDDGPAARSWARPISPAEEVLVRVKGRIEPVPPPPVPPATWLPTSLDPAGVAWRFEALERIDGELTGRLLTEVTAARPVRVRAAGNQARARWSFEALDDSVLGTSVPYTLDGAPGGTIRAALTRGTVRLPVLTPGDHVVAAQPPAGLRLFVNLPPTPGDPAAAYRARTVWRITQPITLTVRTDSRGPRALNIVVYDPSPTARMDRTLTGTVDGGSPRRRGHGVYTRSTPVRRTWTLPDATGATPAVLVDGDRERIGLARTLILPLGDDLLPGLHTIVLRPSAPMYARFFAVVPPGIADTTVRWPESNDE